jgi:predicted metal-dependent peptidase
MAMFYEVSDVKLEIDKRSQGYDDLNEWARNVATKEDLEAIKKVMKDAMLGVRTSLTNRMAFHGTFSMSMKTYISFELPAPMGVNVTTKGLSVTPNLFINPLWLIYKLGRKTESAPGIGDGGEFVDSTTFVDTAVILYHEMCHILWEHPNVYKQHSENGYHEIVNLATDTQINQDPLIASNKNITDYGITLDKMKKMFGLPNLKANQPSYYYFEEFMKVWKQKQQQRQQKCAYCQQQEQQQQQQNGQGQDQDQNAQDQSQDQNTQDQGQGQNGQDQSQGQNGQGQDQDQNGQDQGQGQNGQDQGQGQNGQGQGQGQNGQGQGQGSVPDHCTCGRQHGHGQGQGSGQGTGLDDHNTWYKTPSDVTTEDGDSIGKIASQKDTRTAVADIVKRVSQDPVVRDKVDSQKMRGLMAGGLYDQAIEGKSEKGKLPLKTVLQQGIGRLRAGVRSTYSRIYKHQGNRPVIKKGKKKLWNKNIRVFLDNSGSMGTFEISWATMEVAAIAKAIKANLSIIPFDTVVYSENEQVIPKSGKFKFVPTGRGGTSFQPVFDYMKQVGVTNQNDVVIIISDGYGESHIENYGFRNVIWVMVESKTNTLSVREQDIRGHLVAYLEDDYRYKIEKIGA